MMPEIYYKPIGIVRSPHKSRENMPIQPVNARGVKAKIELNSEYTDGLKDLDGFSHIILLYHFHKTKGFQLQVKPFMDDKLHGVFATRAPRRPNGIGMSVVRLKQIEGNILYIEDVDILDETPVLDIKPFFSKFDNRHQVISGWLDEKWEEKKYEIKSDDRFIE